MTFELFIRLTALLLGLLIVGTLLCLPLYKGSFKALAASSLFTKILWWGPIFIVVVAVLAGQLLVASIVSILLIIQALREWRANNGAASTAATVYFVVFSLFILHIPLWFLQVPTSWHIELLAAVAVASVLSDVCAFFLGNYIGKHHLPAWLNKNKSWEGVAGQLLGAFAGAGLSAAVLGINLPLFLIIIIGVTSAIGDLANSYAKRVLDIKDWGNTIPGHGGVLDRLSSLSFAIAASYWWAVVYL